MCKWFSATWNVTHILLLRCEFKPFKSSKNKMTSIENNTLHNAILERGTFYYPAWKHYNNPSASVNCDRCRRTNIQACVGFEKYDYCILCVHEVVASRRCEPGPWHPDIMPPRVTPETPVQTITTINSLQPPPMTLTLMAQDMFVTRMADPLFRIQNNHL
jgi:hypothetical protein